MDGSVAQNITYREKHCVYVAACFCSFFLWSALGQVCYICELTEFEKNWRNDGGKMRKGGKERQKEECFSSLWGSGESHTESLDLEKELKW